MSDLPDSVQLFDFGGFNKRRTRWVVYGESGSGKTVLASTFPNPLFLDVEDGTASITLPFASWRVSDWNDIFEALAWLTSDPEHDFQTVVIDSLNELQLISMRHIITNYSSVRRAYDSLPSVSDYGKMLDDVDRVVRILKSLPMHVVFLAQVQNREYETDAVRPQLVGKNTATNVARMMDVIAYLYKQEGDKETRRFLAFDVPDFVTKDRSGRLPSSLELQNRDTGFEQVFTYWEDLPDIDS
jgi:KaiC/GvpD/RAD55 family RecA-like ATPase